MFRTSLKNWQQIGYFRAAVKDMSYRGPLTKQWIQSGAVIGMGTDNGTPMNFHTDALWREMKAFVDEGMPPLQVIGDATRVNAGIMGRTTSAPSKPANWRTSLWCPTIPSMTA